MRSIFILAILAIAAVNAQDFQMECDFCDLEDFVFMQKIFYNLYNGFSRGLYRETAHTIIDQRCLGDWNIQNISKILDVVEKVFEMDFTIPYADAVEAATDAVNLIYKNGEYCKFDKLVYDLDSICPMDGSDSDCLNEDKFFSNVKTNLVQIVMRVQQIWDLFSKDDYDTDEEVLTLVDNIGEIYGGFISYITGFDQRYNGKTHKYRNLSFPKLPEISLPDFQFPQFF
jgi:hypothetical protein